MNEMGKTSQLTKKVIGAGAVKHIANPSEFAFICFMIINRGLDEAPEPVDALNFFSELQRSGYKSYLLLDAEVREEVKAYFETYKWSLPSEVKALEKDLTS